MENTTIAAIATPMGSGGIGVVRMSGPDAFAIVGRIFRGNGGKAPCEMAGYSGRLGRVFDGNGDIDDAICFVYRGPRSYTGEDVVELSSHGGVWAVQAVLRLCLDNGAVAAAPGEFTKRAFLNGKLNLSQAEAVMDLIGAQGQSAMRAALAARDGALSTKIAKIVENLLAQSAHLAAWADYPEEEIETVDSGELLTALQGANTQIDVLLATYDQGKILREGVATAIIGKPNVGKSTLMNLLAGQQRSIVTDIPGTTRDIVEDSVRLGDCVLRLADTAGIRATDDPVESVGVARAKAQMETAQLILAVFDSSDLLDEQDLQLLELLADRTCIAVINKTDLTQWLDIDAIRRKIPRLVRLSAQSGEGRDELELLVLEVLGLNELDPSAAIVANERQRHCLLEARQSLGEAVAALEAMMTMDAVNVCIDYALDALLSLTGQRASDKVVDEVFARFCVGK